MDSADVGIRAEASGAEVDARADKISTFAWPAALFLMIVFFVAVDLAADLASGMTSTHVLAELAALAAAMTGVAGAAWQIRRVTRRGDDLHRDLLRTRADADHWRSEAHALLERLGTALEHQFERWGLTEAESEIALLILKGLAYKDVANARGTTERTVRHQALAIYRKAGFAGRAEMAAFFLQDLLLPGRSASRVDHRAEGRAAKTMT